MEVVVNDDSNSYHHDNKNTRTILIRTTCTFSFIQKTNTIPYYLLNFFMKRYIFYICVDCNICRKINSSKLILLLRFFLKS